MRVKCENPLGFLKTEKTHLLKKRRRKRIRRYEDYRLHHARARTLYSRRRGRIQLMKNRIIGAAKQVIHGTIQFVRKQHERFSRRRIFCILPACDGSRWDAKLFGKRIWLCSADFAHPIKTFPKQQIEHHLFVQKHESHKNEKIVLISHFCEIIIYLTNDSFTC